MNARRLNVLAPASGVLVAQLEVRRVNHAILVPGEELAGPFAVAPGEVADAGRGVDRKVGGGIEPPGQASQVVLVTPEVAADDTQLRKAGEHTVAGRQDRFLGGCPARPNMCHCGFFE